VRPSPDEHDDPLPLAEEGPGLVGPVFADRQERVRFDDRGLAAVVWPGRETEAIR